MGWYQSTLLICMLTSISSEQTLFVIQYWSCKPICLPSVSDQCSHKMEVHCEWGRAAEASPVSLSLYPSPSLPVISPHLIVADFDEDCGDLFWLFFVRLSPWLTTTVTHHPDSPSRLKLYFCFTNISIQQRETQRLCTFYAPVHTNIHSSIYLCCYGSHLGGYQNALGLKAKSSLSKTTRPK